MFSSYHKATIPSHIKIYIYIYVYMSRPKLIVILRASHTGAVPLSSPHTASDWQWPRCMVVSTPQATQPQPGICMWTFHAQEQWCWPPAALWHGYLRAFVCGFSAPQDCSWQPMSQWFACQVQLGHYSMCCGVRGCDWDCGSVRVNNATERLLAITHRPRPGICVCVRQHWWVWLGELEMMKSGRGVFSSPGNQGPTKLEVSAHCVSVCGCVVWRHQGLSVKLKQVSFKLYDPKLYTKKLKMLLIL